MENISKKIITFIEITGKEKCKTMLTTLQEEGFIDKEINIMERIENEFVKKEVKQCEAMVYNGKRRCELDTQDNSCYCKRHKRYNKDSSNANPESKVYQCIMKTSDGNRCCKTVKEENSICYIHKLQSKFSKPKSIKYRCIYNTEFTEEEEEDNVQCSRPVKNGTWFCGYHKRYQVLACEMYKSTSHSDYIEKIEENKIKRDEYVDENIKRVIT